MTVQSSVEIWRDYETDGVPASGPHEPVKRDVRQWGSMLESLLAQLGLGYATKAALDADLAHGANTLAMVYADATAANNGIYVKSGASGAGSWSRIGDLPDAIIPLTVTGGTGDAIVATAPSTPMAPGRHLYLLTPTANNTGASTINVNGTGAVAIKNALNANLAAGSLLIGNGVLMFWMTDHYQLLVAIPPDGDAVLADVVQAKDDAEAARDAAEDARDIAIATIGMVVYPTVAAYAAATVSLADGTNVYIANYYASEPGGGHWCKIASSPPSHGAYHTSANGKYAILAETFPNFRMFGARPANADNTPYLDMWNDYCDANTNCSTLDIGASNWTFTTVPRPIWTPGIPWGRTIRGAGRVSTILYTNYSVPDYRGFIHLLAQGGGAGLIVRDLQITSQKTDFSCGAAIASHDGHVQKLVVGGTITAGNALTATVNGTAVTYTVGGGDTAKSIANGVASAINANVTIATAGVIAFPINGNVSVISKASSPATVTTGTTGTTTLTRTVLGQFTTGFITLDALVITSANGWSYPLLLDGTRGDVNPIGIRDVSISNCSFFGGHYASVLLNCADGVSVTNSDCILAGGASGSLIITGTATQKSQNFIWSGGAINDIILDNAAFGVITTGKVLAGVQNTSATDSVKIMAGSIVGTAQTNWTNSAYVT
ncbi:hypothetical protein [Bradyrhizobium sp. SEMIA]|uniref:hypothetical protein n=1 Tax=Bradyrhizobium sp. SEMIA TaxID=2597515 RepID=UPI0018A532AE|nr:hypothetical protein [Bradyrhizobium sp. SEMIA]QOG20471.1 hypothetical protein FOM02_27065 [Bradyrhizobium sp. SEMIA]